MNPYLSLARIKAGLHSLDIRPSRGMGQNFLLDANALQSIVNAADLRATDWIVEVGPGFGVLTWELTQRAGRVISVELDKRLAERLQHEFESTPALRIIQSDILRVAPAELFAAESAPPSSYKVVANLPYAITSPVLRHFLEAYRPPTVMVVLVQWEVAERIAAKPGDMSMLAHAIQMYAEPEIVARVRPESFYPAPAVDSAVLRLHVRPQPQVPRTKIEPLLRIVKAGFLHARKTLANALPNGLASIGEPCSRDAVISVLRLAGIDPQRRAETLSLDEWILVYDGLAALRSPEHK
jgi:16S rRNA (adenine1518-N6/adenine1519-N6)-dimethyltransferase